MEYILLKMKSSLVKWDFWSFQSLKDCSITPSEQKSTHGSTHLFYEKCIVLYVESSVLIFTVNNCHCICGFTSIVFSTIKNLNEKIWYEVKKKTTIKKTLKMDRNTIGFNGGEPL